MQVMNAGCDAHVTEERVMGIEDPQYALRHPEFRKNEFYREAKYQKVVESVRRSGPNQKILNVGCSSGELNNLLAREGHRVTGIDILPEAVRQARASASQENLDRIIILQEDLLTFRPVEPFDAVVATDVIEHMPDDALVLAKMAGYLNPGGRLLLTVPALPALFGYHDVEAGHFRRYSKRDLQKKLDRFFKEVALRWIGFSLIPVCFWYSKVLRKTYPYEKVTKKTFLSKVARNVISFEQKMPVPLGISLFAEARKK
ncbi:MAG: class I SAM-dependent methyltransferase [Candidatus Omnitrophica bacterium]|nr:class I SAM-dependent methyltransferase [Candidatus Omnitrophota bacterium]